MSKEFKIVNVHTGEEDVATYETGFWFFNCKNNISCHEGKDRSTHSLECVGQAKCKGWKRAEDKMKFKVGDIVYLDKFGFRFYKIIENVGEEYKILLLDEDSTKSWINRSGLLVSEERLTLVMGGVMFKVGDVVRFNKGSWCIGKFKVINFDHDTKMYLLKTEGTQPMNMVWARDDEIELIGNEPDKQSEPEQTEKPKMVIERIGVGHYKASARRKLTFIGVYNYAPISMCDDISFFPKGRISYMCDKMLHLFYHSIVHRSDRIIQGWSCAQVCIISKLGYDIEIIGDGKEEFDNLCKEMEV